MEKRIGLLGVIVENEGSVEELNRILHDYARIIIGRMGIPYPERGVSVISLVLDGTNDEIGALSGKLGRLEGVSVKTALSKKAFPARKETL